MDIENLSKAQLLLLTLLVNFVVSIATAIMTVSLLEKAPPVITQTVNRIVERTVETVTPSSAGTVTHEKTIVVKDEDLVISAVAAAKARTVALKVSDSDASPAAIGTYLPRARAIVALSEAIDAKNIVVVFPDGSTAEASFVRSENGVELYGFSDSAKLPDATVPAFMPSKSIQAGQSVFAIAGDTSVVTGIVSLADADKVRTTLSVVPAGSQIVNATGDILGLAGKDAGTLLSADILNTLLSATSTPATSGNP